MFGKIESKIKKVSCIADPTEYCSIIEEFATVRKLSAQGWFAQDWKKSITETVKNPGSWHFQFNPTKRFITRMGVPVIKKAENVVKLLNNQFGEKWMQEETLQFYKKAVECGTMGSDKQDNFIDQEESCTKIETRSDLRV
ncbi:hypothetical protein ABEB36_000330 [Hypothenemus hampei]|uniref:Uncharacterized protein n=1 Tax=Hypothenemus hampei TaxID=57062 RepID=A0ABD1FAX4_HYPHA